MQDRLEDGSLSPCNEAIQQLSIGQPAERTRLEEGLKFTGRRIYTTVHHFAAPLIGLAPPLPMYYPVESILIHFFLPSSTGGSYVGDGIPTGPKRIDSIRQTNLGGLILSFGFLWSELVCYAACVGFGVMIDIDVSALKKRLDCTMIQLSNCLSAGSNEGYPGIRVFGLQRTWKSTWNAG
jgi:hypothetical protein